MNARDMTIMSRNGAFLTTVSRRLVVTFFMQPKRSEYKGLRSRGEVFNAGWDKDFNSVAFNAGLLYSETYFFGGFNHHRRVIKAQVF